MSVLFVNRFPSKRGTPIRKVTPAIPHARTVLYLSGLTPQAVAGLTLLGAVLLWSCIAAPGSVQAVKMTHIICSVLQRRQGYDQRLLEFVSRRRRPERAIRLRYWSAGPAVKSDNDNDIRYHNWTRGAHALGRM